MEPRPVKNTNPAPRIMPGVSVSTATNVWSDLKLIMLTEDIVVNHKHSVRLSRAIRDGFDAHVLEEARAYAKAVRMIGALSSVEAVFAADTSLQLMKQCEECWWRWAIAQPRIDRRKLIVKIANVDASVLTEDRLLDEALPAQTDPTSEPPQQEALL